MRKGFTLIELLVVVLIIGILAAVALPQYTKAVEKSRTAEALTLMGDLATAERIYQMATGSFTANMNKLDIEMPGLSGDSNTITTKNYVITITTPAAVATDDASGFVVKAVRSNNGAATSGSQVYTLGLALSPNGTIQRYCTSSATSGNVCASLGNDISSVAAVTDFVIPGAAAATPATPANP